MPGGITVLHKGSIALARGRSTDLLDSDIPTTTYIVADIIVMDLTVCKAVEGDFGLLALTIIMKGNEGPRNLLMVWDVDLCGASVDFDYDGSRIVGKSKDFECLLA